jgi:apolipoprotein D and lipocalin family protein
MKTLLSLLIVFATFTLTACYSERAATQPQTSVSQINLDKYVGTWYEIARFDAFFQKNCVAVTAEYQKIENDKISVVNTCRLKTIDGEIKQATGTARIPDPAKPAQLKVRFNQFGANFFEGDYWVIALDKNYRWAVVSEERGRYLWVLSRTPTMNDKTYHNIVRDLEAKGIQTKFLQKTEQGK